MDLSNSAVIMFAIAVTSLTLSDIFKNKKDVKRTNCSEEELDAIKARLDALEQRANVTNDLTKEQLCNNL